MLDTLEIRIHGILDRVKNVHTKIQSKNSGADGFILPHHNDLYMRMLNHKGSSFSIKKTHTKEVTQQDEGEHYDFIYHQINKAKNRHSFTNDEITFVDEEKVKKILKSATGNTRLPSSLKDVTFRLNHNAGYIGVNCSIPKYLYGHSLAQFVPQVDNGHYHQNSDTIHTFRAQKKLLYNRLIAFVKRLLTDLEIKFKLDTPLDMNYVEIRRVDMCFNQFFKSKNESLEYLEHLKNTTYKKHRKGQKAKAEYDTTLVVESANGAYFKIYHKGTEYSQSKDGDLKFHLQQNYKALKQFEVSDQWAEFFKLNIRRIYDVMDNLGKGVRVHIDDLEFVSESHKSRFHKLWKMVYDRLPYKVDFFKAKMDLVLRYEISFRGDWLNYHYKHHIFRADDDVHQYTFKKYKETKVIIENRPDEIQSISRKLRKNYDMYNKFFGSASFFFLSDNFFLQRHEQYSGTNFNPENQQYEIQPFGLNIGMFNEKHVATFQPKMLDVMFDKFISMVHLHQVHFINNFDDLATRIKGYNQQAEQNVIEYDIVNDNKCYVDLIKRERIKKNGKPVKKASQLLTQKQKSDMNMKKVSAVLLMSIARELGRKGTKRSIAKIRDSLGVSRSQFSRYLDDLEKFGVYEQSVVAPRQVETRVDLMDYYNLCSAFNTKPKIYAKKIHSRYG